MSCPGSIALSKGLANTSSQYADEGTAAHFLGATCLQNKADASNYVGRVVELLQGADGEHYEAFQTVRPAEVKLLNSFTVDDDMAEAVQVYVDYVRDLVKSSGGILFVEVQVPIDHLTGEEGATGTSDTIILADEEIINVDLKFGRGVEVSAIENKQMRIYSSGALRYIEDLVGGTKSIKRVRMAISQPRISKLPSEWACSIEDLWAFEELVQSAANVCDAATKDFHDTKHVDFNDWKDKHLTASEDACRFCLVKARCPKVIEVIEENLGEGFTNLDAIPAVTTGEGNALLSKHLSVIDFVEGWCKAVRAEGESQLLQGIPVPGYKIVQGRKGNRSWIDEAAAEALLKKLKLKKDEMYVSKLISPAAAEKVIGKDDPRWPKVTAAVTQSEGGLSIAPDSDKRPAVEIKPTTDGFFPLDKGD
jgi:hypothetical protein